MAVDESNNRRPYRTRPWRRAIGLLLFLPIGLIAVLVLILFGGKGSSGGWWWVILIAVFLIVFLVRISYRRSRRRDWKQRHQGQIGPMEILRERYAKGDITKEQFDQMSQDLQQRENR